MAVNGQSAIWRDGTETSSSDKIEFNDGAIVPNDSGNVMNTSFSIPTGIAVNERPGAIDKLQDTGVSGVTITVTGTIDDPESTGETTAHRFKTWGLEAKTVVSTFPKGRFGLRLNDFGVFDMTPNTYKGYILQNIDFTRDGITKGKIAFVAVLRFNGDITNNGAEPNGSGEYEW